MILSISRRTDIPAFYAPWLMNRLREGYVMVRNPIDPHKISRIALTPDVVDFIVFWTKNPQPIMPYLEEIREISPFYFQYTLNGYEKDIEPGMGAIEERMKTFCNLAERIGDGKVIWRYDPILLSDKYTVDWHIKRFSEIAEGLRGYANTCVISFVDLYDKVKTNAKAHGFRECNSQEMQDIASAIAEIAHDHDIRVQSCAESINLEACGIEHGCCIDGNLISRILGAEINTRKDSGQRTDCRCVASIDIGQYNTCMHRCAYCYANADADSTKRCSKEHIPESPLLIGRPEPEDIITERKNSSLIRGIPGQISMFEE